MKTYAQKFDNYEKAIFWSGLFCVSLLLVLYGYFLNSAIHNVVNREKAENKVAEISSKIGELEYQYIALKNGITSDLAYSLGFETLSNPTFIAVRAPTKGLSLKP